MKRIVPLACSALLLFSCSKKDEIEQPKTYCTYELDYSSEDIDFDQVELPQEFRDTLDAHPELIPYKYIGDDRAEVLHCRVTHRRRLVHTNWYLLARRNGRVEVRVDERIRNQTVDTTRLINVARAERIARSAEEFSSECLPHRVVVYDKNWGTGYTEADYTVAYHFWDGQHDVIYAIVDARDGTVLEHHDGIYY